MKRSLPLMDKKKLLLQVDPELNFSVNVQIREQLKWLLGMGLIRAGDMLPPAGQLAEELGINRNTINWVYTQLRDEGLVTMQKGRGTQVTAKAQQLRKQRLPMLELLESTIREAKEKGMELLPFFTAGLAYSLLHPLRPSAQHPFLLVECKGHDHLFYSKAISEATGRDVETLFLEDLWENKTAISEVVERFPTIITTVNHAEEVQKLFGRLEGKILVIGATVETSFLLEVAALKQDSHVTFACLGKTGGEWMASRVWEAGIRQIRAETLGWEEDGKPANSLQQADKIYASAAVYSELAKLAPNKVLLYPMRLEESSKTLLRNLT
jgi:GntR family transcriptional regulator